MAQFNYVTQSGDTWDAIAFRLFNKQHPRPEFLLHLLLRENPEHAKTVIFGAGVLLKIPDIPENIPESLPPWKR